MAEKLRSGNTIISDSAERTLDFLFAQYLNTQPGAPTRLSETDVRQISEGLQRIGKDSWAKVPRLYTVLRLVNNLQCIDVFLAEGVSDIWFPFTYQTLPNTLRSATARFRFLKLQDLVLTKAFDLEREDGKHRHFLNSEDIPLRKLEELGKGGFGSVDRVLSTITYREYARKLISRGKTFKKNSAVLKDFERELGHLKRLSHIHIVEFVGSYTDPRCVGLLMSPVADYNLEDFLARGNLTAGERSFLRTFYGCMTTALCYLHEKQVRHKDIKPQNVLVKGHQVYLTDFGISLDWSNLGQSTTSGITVHTPRYCAPEVAQRAPRNSLSDVWSLGCIFLEAWTVLKGRTIKDLVKFLSTVGTGSTCYHLNQQAALQWCDSVMAGAQDVNEDAPVDWIREMLQPESDHRWTAQALLTRIHEAEQNPAQRYAFVGTCCAYQDDSSLSLTSDKGSMILDETTAWSNRVCINELVSVRPSSENGTGQDIPASHDLRTLEMIADDKAMKRMERTACHGSLHATNQSEKIQADDAPSNDKIEPITLPETFRNDMASHKRTPSKNAHAKPLVPGIIHTANQNDRSCSTGGMDSALIPFLPSSASLAYYRYHSARYCIRVRYRNGQVWYLERSRLEFERLDRDVNTFLQNRHGAVHAAPSCLPQLSVKLELEFDDLDTYLESILWIPLHIDNGMDVGILFVPKLGFDYEEKSLYRHGQDFLEKQDNVIRRVRQKRKELRLVKEYHFALFNPLSRRHSLLIESTWYVPAEAYTESEDSNSPAFWFPTTWKPEELTMPPKFLRFIDDRRTSGHNLSLQFWLQILDYSLASFGVSYVYKIESHYFLYFCRIAKLRAKTDKLLEFEIYLALGDRYGACEKELSRLSVSALRFGRISGNRKYYQSIIERLIQDSKTWRSYL